MHGNSEKSDQPIFIENLNHLKVVKSLFIIHQRVEFKCSLCGQKGSVLLCSCENLVCTKCKLSLRKKNRSEEDKKAENEKRKNTAIKRYGSLENFRKIKSERSQATKMKNHGNPFFCNVEKIKETWENKSEESLKKFSETMKNVSKMGSKEFIEKSKKCLLEKHGNENWRNVEKQKETCRMKYGVDWAQQSEEFYKNRKRKSFGDLKFDSSMELNYYLYLTKILKLELGKDFEMQKKYPKPYFEDNGEKHFTFIDFYIKDQDLWVECKGKHFFKEDGSANWVYNTKKNPEDSKRKFLLWQKKLEFLKEEKVKIITNVIKKGDNYEICEYK